MKRLGWLAVPFLAGCFWLVGERAVECPPEFHSHRINISSKYFTGTACSIDPSEMQVDGVKPGDSIQSVADHWAEPNRQYAAPLPGGLPVYEFSNAVKVSTTADGEQVWLIESGGTNTNLKAPRGIALATPCEVIAEKFGPSHEGPGTYTYRTQGSGTWLTLEFQCQTDHVVGFTLSGS